MCNAILIATENTFNFLFRQSIINTTSKVIRLFIRNNQGRGMQVSKTIKADMRLKTVFETWSDLTYNLI